MANPSPTAPRPAEQDAPSPAKPEGEKPATSFRYGSVSAAVFTSPLKLRSGKTVTRASVSLRKSYRTAQGTWEHTHSLGTEDLLPAAFALTQCAAFIASLPSEDAE